MSPRRIVQGSANNLPQNEGAVYPDGYPDGRGGGQPDKPVGNKPRHGQSYKAWIAELCAASVPAAVKLVDDIVRGNVEADIRTRKQAAMELMQLCASSEESIAAAAQEAAGAKVIYLVDADKAQELLAAQRAAERKP